MIRFYDTSALLSLADTIELDKDCYISSFVISELENIKTAYNKDEHTRVQARKITRLLCNTNNYITSVKYLNKAKKKLQQYVKKGLPDNNDSLILLEASIIGGLRDTMLFTGDITMFLFAREFFPFLQCSLVSETSEKRFWDGIIEITPTEEEWLKLSNKDEHSNFFNLKINEFAILKNNENKVNGILRWDGENYVQLGYQDAMTLLFGKISPRNLEQKCYFDLLQNPNIPVVNCVGRVGSGKAIDNEALIPTPNGFVKMGELKVGDYVFDRLGKPTKILGVYPQGLCDAYDVYFKDGRKVCCNNEHLWTYYSDNRGNLNTKTLQEIIDEPRKDGYKIPVCKPVEYSHKNFSIHPYVIGVLIGSGICGLKPLGISSENGEIPDKIASLIPEVEDKAIRSSEKCSIWRFRLKEPCKGKNGHLVKNLQTEAFLKDYPALCKKSSFKEIPEEYLFGDIQQRYELLQGLLDTDGSIDTIPKGRIRFTTTSAKLAQQVQQLCYSLGLISIINKDIRENKYSEAGACYTLFIFCAREEKHKLFSLSYKRERALSLEPSRPAQKNDRMSITNIVKLPYKKEMTCILVENPEHLFLANDYIVTHNTYVAIANALYLIERGQYDKLIYVRNNFSVENTKDPGALPGDLDAKLRPFLGPLIDIVGSEEYVDQLIEERKVEQVHLGYLRGRSLKNCFVLVDESQNLTPSHVKMLLSRMAENSKLVFCGDYSQCDSKIFRSEGNGILKMNERLADNKLYGQIRLNKIERSEVCQLADKMD